MQNNAREQNMKQRPGSQDKSGAAFEKSSLEKSSSQQKSGLQQRNLNSQSRQSGKDKKPSDGNLRAKATAEKTAAKNKADESVKKKDNKTVKPKKEKKQKSRQHEIYVAGVIICGILALTLCYFVWFEVIGKNSVIARPENNRTSNLENTVLRGDIVTADGAVIAKSVENEDGSQSRIYPYGNLFAHTVGYAVLGGSGLEKTEKINLLTADISFIDQLKNELFSLKAKGNTLVTTFDSDLQSYCYSQLSGKSGSIIVMEPKTGRVLAMVSTPDFDPNTVSENWNYLVSDDNTSGNLLNRGTQSTFAPGSTFKLLTLLEYIRENPDTWQQFSYTCYGTYTNGSYSVSCHEGHAHGTVDIYGALAQSCNGAFDTMAMTLDRNRWQELVEDFGYNKSITEIAGLDEKEAENFSFDFSFKKSSFDIASDDGIWARMQMAIGQGTVSSTPLLNLMDYCAVANGGVMMKPYLKDYYYDANNNVVSRTDVQQLTRVCTQEEAQLLNQFLVKVINEGTAGQAACSYAQVAGKTGSAQYTSAGDFHAWFCGYAPAEDPKIALCVFIEGGGSGGEVAAPIAGNIFNYYFGR